MSREEFIKSYLQALGVFVNPDTDVPHTRVTLELIGSIWDLQQQIAQLQDDLYAK
jgi:protein gp37